LSRLLVDEGLLQRAQTVERAESLEAVMTNRFLALLTGQKHFIAIPRLDWFMEAAAW
jgi:hypothetical protein